MYSLISHSLHKHKNWISEFKIVKRQISSCLCIICKQELLSNLHNLTYQALASMKIIKNNFSVCVYSAFHIIITQYCRSLIIHSSSKFQQNITQWDIFAWCLDEAWQSLSFTFLQYCTDKATHGNEGQDITRCAMSKFLTVLEKDSTDFNYGFVKS